MVCSNSSSRAVHSVCLPQLALCQQPRLHLCTYALKLLLLLRTGPAPRLDLSEHLGTTSHTVA